MMRDNAPWLAPAERRTKLSSHIRSLALGLDREISLCRVAEVDMRLWRNAAMGRPVNALAHMAICAVLAVDPVTVDICPDSRPGGSVCWATLGAGVRVTRELRGHSVRAAADVVGVSAATISRCENGHELSFDSLARCAAYVGLHPHATTVKPFPEPSSTGNTHCNSLKTQDGSHA
ncbi:helix-turn-helix domain-containing protein [Ancylobacter sp.]|uniref:helix-turn-helix domain-containing protein n=1 Tax=Ancylobacter sp. TaxID=1872567 RepID=UPI003D11263A